MGHPKEGHDGGKQELKFIFLDVDGVLNNDSTRERIGRYKGIEDECVDMLAEIVFSFNPRPRIVLTSSWKNAWDKQPQSIDELDQQARYLLDKLRSRGLGLTGRTEEKDEKQRGQGIQAWLRKVGGSDGWVVLDDGVFPDYEERGIIPHLVRTSGSAGLTHNEVEKAIKILRGV